VLDRALGGGRQADVSAQGSTASAGPALRGSGVNVSSLADTFDVSSRIGQVLESRQLLRVIGLFFLAGVLLSLTPCVLPMLPILSSIIVGEEVRMHGGDAAAAGLRGHVAAWRDRGRAFALAASYALGMALVYTALGVAAGLAGEGLAAQLQEPWVLALFACVLVALALSMFGVYELQLPATWTGKVASASNRLRGGRVAGVFLMGGLSALIVSPCVAAPLAGALVYISQTRDAWLGGTALFSLAVGMSVPLLLIGASAGALLPRAGSWMHGVKVFFGLLLLAVAIWIVRPVLPASVVLALCGVLLIVAAATMGLFRRPPVIVTIPVRVRRIAATLVAVFGALQILGAATGGADPFAPLSHLADGAASAGKAAPALPVTMIRTPQELDEALSKAGRPVMVDFYADWCVSCKEMEHRTYTDPRVRAKLDKALVLKIDVTRNSPDDRALLRRFNLFGPPGTLFFDPQGRELAGQRVIGFQSADRFLETLSSAGL
jgi:thiol:disulfide interchange protein DsbD